MSNRYGNLKEILDVVAPYGTVADLRWAVGLAWERVIENSPSSQRLEKLYASLEGRPDDLDAVSALYHKDR